MEESMSKIILIRGKAGVGKTTISSYLGKKLKVPVIRKDDIYDSIANYIDNHNLRNKACYDTMYKIIKTNIEHDLYIVVDAGFHDINDALNFKQWVIDKGADFLSILCICSDESLWAERFNKRKHNPQPNNLITDFSELKLHYKDLYTKPLDNELILDTVEDIEVLIEKAVIEIGKRNN